MFQSLNHYQAFSAGADLWILPFDPQNFWFKKINWKTQFLLQDPRSSQSITHSLILPTEKTFPNQSILCLPIQKTSWIPSAHQHWLKLKKPSLRLFLRENESLDNIEQNWPKEDFIYNLSYLK